MQNGRCHQALTTEHAEGKEMRRDCSVGQVRRDSAASRQVKHRGCKFAVSSRDSKLDLRRDGDLPREQKGLESIGCSFWELLPPRIQQVK